MTTVRGAEFTRIIACKTLSNGVLIVMGEIEPVSRNPSDACFAISANGKFFDVVESASARVAYSVIRGDFRASEAWLSDMAKLVSA